MRIDYKISGIDGCLLVHPGRFKDDRGEFVMSYSKKEYPCLDFVEDDFSVSKKMVFRGLHGDWKTVKLVQCLFGEVHLTVLDCRKHSKTLGHKFVCVLNDKNKSQVLIPSGCANGHLVTSKKAIFSYKQDQYYNRESQFTLDCKKFCCFTNGYEDKFILSNRDKFGPFSDMPWLPEWSYNECM